MASRRRALFLAALALALCERRRCRMRQRPRRFWVRKIFTEEAKKRGEWETVVEELTTNDREFFFKYLRMSPERFEHLFSMVGLSIEKKDTNYRKSIPARKRLVIALRYLAEGSSQQALSMSFRVGKSTVCKIVKEVCDAMYNVLSPIYLRPPSTEEEWKQVSEEFSQLWNMPPTHSKQICLSTFQFELIFHFECDFRIDFDD